MILVAGATGVLGSEIARRLLARGEKVRAMVRTASAPGKVERLEKAGAEIVRADVTDKIRYVAVADVAEFAMRSLSRLAARNATVPIGGPDEISQRDAVRIFEEAYGQKFSVIEVPEAVLDAQWRSAENPFDKTFAGLMLGLARGFDSGVEPPFDKFPMQMTSPREYVRRMAKGSEATVDGAPRQGSRADKPGDAGQEELR